MTWSVDGGESKGTISASGIYTAPATVAGQVTVGATSVSDPRWDGTATVTVTALSLTPARLVRIEPGTFLMGSPTGESGRADKETQHWVRISKPFLLSDSEVTQAQWYAVMGTNPSGFTGSNHPVDRVSWFDAVAYCNALSVKDGYTKAYVVNGYAVTWNRNASGYRLPTESEWECACRAGTTTLYWSGTAESDLSRAAWYSGNSGGETHDVKKKAANAWGLFDIHGNLWEWCWDVYGTYPTGTQANPAVDPVNQSSGDLSSGRHVARAAHGTRTSTPPVCDARPGSPSIRPGARATSGSVSPAP